MNIKQLLVAIVVLVVLSALWLVFSTLAQNQRVAAISTFNECARAGYPIMESYPEQCATPDGRTFVNDTHVAPSAPQEGGGTETSGGITSNGCAIAGCSAQLCVSAEEAASIVSTCEYRSEYACYREASCEPQTSGKCGWTPSAILAACLQNPPPIDASSEQVY